MIQRLSDLLCDATSLAENVLDIVLGVAAVKRREGKGYHKRYRKQRKRNSGTRGESEENYKSLGSRWLGAC